MKSALMLASIIIIGTGLIGSAYAHKSQVIDNYKFEVGWNTEPPVTGKPNSIVVTVSKVESTEKISSKQGNVKNQKYVESPDSKTKQGIKKLAKSSQKAEKKTPTRGGISGLSKILEVDVTLNGKKMFLNLVEDKKNLGTYLGAYTPESDGYPIVHLYGKLDSKDMEITFHPEKIEAK